MMKRIWRAVFGNMEINDASYDVEAATILGAIQKARNQAKKKPGRYYSLEKLISVEMIAEIKQ